MPEYRPRDVWAPKRALFGQVYLIRKPTKQSLISYFYQNDYIDILGSEYIHPVSLHYHVPFYARGMKGNEFKMILHKRKMLQQTPFVNQQPKKWRELNKRINYLYRFMNRKTPNPRDPTNQW
jgi:large subunit ribosomal protein L51